MLVLSEGCQKSHVTNTFRNRLYLRPLLAAAAVAAITTLVNAAGATIRFSYPQMTDDRLDT